MAEPNHRKGCFVGVDLGGTKILSGVFDHSLRPLATAKLSTKAERGPAIVLQRIARCIQDAVDEADLALKDVRAIGIGAPGTVDVSDGTVILAPNLDWHEVPLRRDLEELLEIPVQVENDCNAALAGIHAVELKGKSPCTVGIFVGTGIGGGVMMDGQLQRGGGYAAGEFGHVVLDLDGPKCSCGNRGCFEALASRRSLIQRIKTAVKSGESTLLSEMLEDLDSARSGDLRKAYRRGDKLVRKVVDDAAHCVGVMVANLTHVLNPDVVVLGGGVLDALESEMMPSIEEVTAQRVMGNARKSFRLMCSELGDLAGITGCAYLAKEFSV